ncbi:FGGY family carbohydrate kinase [Conexibacter arvalis]|uniref:Sugar (Pentulose or hexulose) kinase n=1 Tax=Conexibacter arvalis TaxID=912552 RepID=A0A840IIJ9_9ACTN|nr:sugar (pentulose or hexulose) kinase [Conexibacter arvalis]
MSGPVGAGAATPAVIAVDAGSSRLRVSLVALEDGAVLASEAVPTRSADGELDADAAWRDLVGLLGVLDRAGADVQALGVAAQLGTVLVDERGVPVRPAMLWGDVRAVAEARELEELLDDELRAAIGRRPTAELPVAKLRRLAVREPEALARARWALSFKDALVHRLTGRAVSDAAHASYSGLFDVRARAWAPAVAAAAGVDPALLPPTAPGAAVAGGLDAEVARATGLAAGLPVAVGGPDGTLGALGAGAARAGVTVDVAGTTDVLLHTLDRPLADPARAVVLNAHVVEGLWTVGGPTGPTGGAVEWTARLLGYDDAAAAHAALGAAAEAVAPAAAPLFVTSLAGSRFPTWRTEDTGLLAGMRFEHGPAHVLRAAQEGAAQTVGAGIDALRELGVEIGEVVVVGGAAARPATLQLRSDAWGLPVVGLANREATTVGAAMLAAVAAGRFATLAQAADALVRRAGRHTPRPETAAACEAARLRWRDVQRRHFGP